MLATLVRIQLRSSKCAFKQSRSDSFVKTRLLETTLIISIAWTTIEKSQRLSYSKSPLDCCLSATSRTSNLKERNPRQCWESRLRIWTRCWLQTRRIKRNCVSRCQWTLTCDLVGQFQLTYSRIISTIIFAGPDSCSIVGWGASCQKRLVVL